MKTTIQSRTLFVALVAVAALAGLLYANGGPFIVKYPSGDPAAKGVLARIGTDLKPGKEERLKVLKEDLKVSYGLSQDGWYKTDQPRIIVAAIYTIENPTDNEIDVDFGFPILRGVYQRMGMGPMPDIHVILSKPEEASPMVPGGPAGPEAGPGVGYPRGDYMPADMITNSVIYGVIRQNAREAIDKAIAADADLATLATAVKEAKDGGEAARRALADYATGKRKWNPRDAALLAEYVGLSFAKEVYPRDRVFGWGGAGLDANKLAQGNLGPLGAIGEQKATQFFAQLAGAFDPRAAQGYEAIFTAWGGDVKERSVDLKTGMVRPRELTLSDTARAEISSRSESPDRQKAANLGDPTVYARVDYLDEKAPISDAEKASCRTILKNLPVVFTFAPMNLLHYQVKFPPRQTRILTVAYSQYGYKDTADPESYQFAYVVHPASMWKEFGPIHLEITVPEGMPVTASVGVTKAVPEAAANANSPPAGPGIAPMADTYRGTLTEKTGEIFMAVPVKEWEAFVQAHGDKKTPIRAAAQAQSPSRSAAK